MALPILDITDPAFDVPETFDSPKPVGWLARLLAPLVLGGSTLAPHIRASRGAVLSGMGAHILKLPPSTWEKAIDRRIAESPPVRAMRWRMKDIVDLTVESLLRTTRDVQIVNIGGGPAMDSLNAVRLARVRASVEVVVLDIDREGPAFGAHALEVWKNGPLAGLDVSFRHALHDWKDPFAFDESREVIVVSEGGLFEYGTDPVILANLERARGHIVIGSVTRAETTAHAAIVPRGLDAFRALAQKAGFEIERALEGPFSDQVRLLPRR